MKKNLKEWVPWRHNSESFYWNHPLIQFPVNVITWSLGNVCFLSGFLFHFLSTSITDPLEIWNKDLHLSPLSVSNFTENSQHRGMMAIKGEIQDMRHKVIEIAFIINTKFLTTCIDNVIFNETLKNGCLVVVFCSFALTQ